MSLLLDTNVIVDVLRGRSLLAEHLARVVESGETLSTTPTNVAEVYAGLRPHERSRTDAFFAAVECTPLSAAIGLRAGLLMNHWKRRGRTLTLADMLVAATAIEHGFVLATYNRKDFPMPELTFHPLPAPTLN